METDLISIVVPVYNVQEYLRECIDSILNQTYQNLEIILVDDGSTDNSGHICDEYTISDSRIKVFHKPNGGLSDARNYGIDRAMGNYIGFVDSDDWIEPDMYERLLANIKGHNADIAVCGLVREYVNHSEAEKLTPESYDRNTAMHLLLEGIRLHDHAWSKLYKRELFQIIRFPVGRYYEDVLTTYKTFLQATTIVVEPKALYHYRQRGGSLIKGSFSDRRFELLIAVESLMQDKRLSKWEEYLRARILRVKYTLIYELATYGDKTSIKKNYPVINTYFNEIKRNKNFLKRHPVTKPLRMIMALSYLPNRILFLMMRLRGSLNRRISTF